MDHPRGAVEKRYIGESGLAYHRANHSFKEEIYTIVARSRARKFAAWVTEEDVVLEYGVGTALNLIGLVCKTRLGFDISPAGRDICAAHGIAFTTSESDLAPASYSVVICHHVLEHVSNPYAMLCLLSTLLRSGGRLILNVPFEDRASYRRFKYDEPNHHLYSWNPQTLGNLVVAAGLELERIDIRPFGYEQRLAPIGRTSFFLYRCALTLVRALRPVREIMLVGRKSDSVAAD
ncbi:MAG: class I SAM-dependent methyltransferase [Bryobacteraceae bacterium]